MLNWSHMIVSALVLSVILPLQIQNGALGQIRLSRPVFLGAGVYMAQLIGLPRLRLRTTNGRPYIPNKAFLEEPLSILYAESGQILGQKKAANDRGYSRVNWQQK